MGDIALAEPVVPAAEAVSGPVPIAAADGRTMRSASKILISGWGTITASTCAAIKSVGRKAKIPGFTRKRDYVHYPDFTSHVKWVIIDDNEANKNNLQQQYAAKSLSNIWKAQMMEEISNFEKNEELTGDDESNVSEPDLVQWKKFAMLQWASDKRLKSPVAHLLPDAFKNLQTRLHDLRSEEVRGFWESTEVLLASLTEAWEMQRKSLGKGSGVSDILLFLGALAKYFEGKPNIIEEAELHCRSQLEFTLNKMSPRLPLLKEAKNE